MPKKVHRCAKKLISKGKPKQSAWAICNASAKKAKRSNRK